MTHKNEDARKILAELDAMSARQKDLADQLVSLLAKAGTLDFEDFDTLRKTSKCACDQGTAFVVTAAMIISEQENGCTIRQLFRDRRPILRVVQ